MNKIITLICLLSIAFAQINIESQRSNDKNVGLNYALYTGNTELVIFGTSFRYSILKNNQKFLNLGDFNVVSGNIYQGMVHFRYNYNFENVTWEFYTQYQFDESSNLKQRLLYGSGWRSPFLKNVHIGISIMFEHELLNLPVNSMHSNKTEIYRGSNYITTNIERDWYALQNTCYYQPYLNDIKDYRLLNELVFTILSKNETISIDNKLTYKYDSKPPDNIDDSDLILKIELVKTF